MTKKIYYIEFNGPSGDGYVSYDNDSCHSLDMAMAFNTEEEANEACRKYSIENNIPMFGEYREEV